MEDLLTKITESCNFIKSKTKLRPKIGLVLGTGLGELEKSIDVDVIIPYKDIPHFPLSTVQSHAGNLIIGKIKDKDVFVLSGRIHYYEGYDIQDVVYPIRVAKLFGIETLIITAAAGGLNPLYQNADLVLVRDHINLMGVNPLRGKNYNELGPRFPDMSNPYDKELADMVEKVALENNIKLQHGVYVGVAGPNLETAAEYRFLRMIGGDVVGMSLVAENIAAIHAGLKVIAIAFISDMCLPDNLQPVKIEHVLKVAKIAEQKVNNLIYKILENL